MNKKETANQVGRGRSAQKRAAKEVESLVRELLDLSDSALAFLPLDEPLRQELEFARTTRGHSSRRRQMKYFAGCLRKNPDQRELIESFLAARKTEAIRFTQIQHELESLRDKLCRAETSASGLKEVQKRFPSADLDKLTSLARSVQQNGDKKAAREIFRRLRSAQKFLELGSGET